MPTPRKGETQQDFVKRCIPMVLEDGTAKSQKQAVAVCHSMWEKEIQVGDEVEAKEGEVEEKMYPMVDEVVTVYDSGPISFSEMKAERAALEATMEVNHMASEFPRMVRRIFNRPDVEDKDAALEALATEFVEMSQQALEDVEIKEMETKAVWTTKYVNSLPDSSFLYVQPGGKKDGEGKTVPRSFRHFPYKDASGKVDLPHLRNAIARIPQSNAPGLTAGKKRSLQERARRMLSSANKEAGWFDSLVARVKETLGMEEKPAEPEGGFTIWKEKDGSYRWLAVFSNNYRDHDNPPEILAGEAHQDFVKAVDGGQWPSPELWLWHVPGTRWGASDWLAYDGHFALASGTVDKGREAVAEAIMAKPDVLVSHGMPSKEIERDSEDPTVITRYRTTEISVLPSEAAANPFTGFSILDKEASMPLPEDKKDFLRGAGLDDEQISQIEADLEGKKESADEAGVENKEETTPPETQQTPPAEPVSDDTPVTRGEVEELARTVGQGLQALTAQVSELAGQVKEISDRQENPSLSDIFKSAVGHDQAREDGRTKLAKAGPKETPPETGENEVLASGNVLANEIIGGIVTGEAWENFPGVQQ